MSLGLRYYPLVPCSFRPQPGPFIERIIEKRLRTKNEDFQMVYTTSSFSGMDLNTEAGRQSAFVTMTLMQMVADAYEGAQEIWDKNSKREMVEGVDDPQLFGPNEAQKGIREWLTHAKFLPPIVPPRPAAPPVTDYPACTPSKTPNTTARSKNILGLRLTTSPKPIRSGTASSSRLPQSPLSPTPIARKTLLGKFRRKSTSDVPTLPELLSEPDLNIPSCSSPKRSSTLPLPAPEQPKNRPFHRTRRFSYKKRIRNVEAVESDASTSSNSVSRPRTKPTPIAHLQAIKLGPIDADTVAQLGVCFPTSRPQPRRQEVKSIPNEKITKDEEEEEDRPEVTWWTLIVVTGLIHLFFVILFLGCLFVGLRRVIRGCLYWNEGE